MWIRHHKTIPSGLTGSLYRVLNYYRRHSYTSRWRIDYWYFNFITRLHKIVFKIFLFISFYINISILAVKLCSIYSDTKRGVLLVDLNTQPSLKEVDKSNRGSGRGWRVPVSPPELLFTEKKSMGKEVLRTNRKYFGDEPQSLTRFTKCTRERTKSIVRTLLPMMQGKCLFVCLPVFLTYWTRPCITKNWSQVLGWNKQIEVLQI